jgi:hypothetical protein
MVKPQPGSKAVSERLPLLPSSRPARRRGRREAQERRSQPGTIFSRDVALRGMRRRASSPFSWAAGEVCMGGLSERLAPLPPRLSVRVDLRPEFPAPDRAPRPPPRGRSRDPIRINLRPQLRPPPRRKPPTAPPHATARRSCFVCCALRVAVALPLSAGRPGSAPRPPRQDGATASMTVSTCHRPPSGDPLRRPGGGRVGDSYKGGCGEEEKERVWERSRRYRTGVDGGWGEGGSIQGLNSVSMTPPDFVATRGAFARTETQIWHCVDVCKVAMQNNLL